MSYPLIHPKPTFFAGTNEVAASGTLEFRSPSTNDLIDVYPTADDADGQTNALTNPVVLDANGQPSTALFLEDGVAYKIVCKDVGGSTLWTIDDVLAPTSNNTLVWMGL